MDDMEGWEEVNGFLAELRSMGDEPAPRPSPKLAVLLVGGVPITNAPSRRRTPPLRDRAMRAALVAAAVLVVSLAAANSVLPGAQQFVAKVVTVLSPFGGSHKPVHHPRPHHPAPPPSSAGYVPAVPAPTTLSRAVPSSGVDATAEVRAPGRHPTTARPPARGATASTAAPAPTAAATATGSGAAASPSADATGAGAAASAGATTPAH